MEPENGGHAHTHKVRWVITPRAHAHRALMMNHAHHRYFHHNCRWMNYYEGQHGQGCVIHSRYIALYMTVEDNNYCIGKSNFCSLYKNNVYCIKCRMPPTAAHSTCLKNSIDGSFFKAKPLLRHHFMVPTRPDRHNCVGQVFSSLPNRRHRFMVPTRPDRHHCVGQVFSSLYTQPPPTHAARWRPFTILL